MEKTFEWYTVVLCVGENNCLYSSKPYKGGIYRSYTWASRWASIHVLTYTPTHRSYS